MQNSDSRAKRIHYSTVPQLLQFFFDVAKYVGPNSPVAVVCGVTHDCSLYKMLENNSAAQPVFEPTIYYPVNIILHPGSSIQLMRGSYFEAHPSHISSRPHPSWHSRESPSATTTTMSSTSTDVSARAQPMIFFVC